MKTQMPDLAHDTVIDFLQHWERTRPDEAWLIQPGEGGQVETMTWRMVADEVRRVASYLRSLALPAGSHIALLGKNSAHWILADLAIWTAGHVSVPLYPTMSADTAKYVLDHCGARLLFVGKLDGRTDGWNEIRKVLPPSLPTVALPMAPSIEAPQWKQVVASHAPLTDVPRRNPAELATIVYTSGTTGRPKGVMHSFATLSAPCRTASEIWQATPADRMLSYLPLAHIAERCAVEVSSLIFGFRVFFADSLDTFPQDLQRARPTIFFSVPRLWTKFYLAINEHLPPKRQKILFSIPLLGGVLKKKILRQLGLDQVRIALTGAAPLPPNIIEWYRNLGLDLLEVFGMTENCATSHACRPGEMRPGYVGTPVPGVDCRIAEDGEVLVRSPGQMLGYYRMPEQTAESMTADGYFRTGDRGETDEKGRLRITGRVKEIFKTSKGKYVAPAPIENRLSDHPKLEVVCVTGPSQPQPFALLMLSADAQKEIDADAMVREMLGREFTELLDRVNQTLEDHERLDYAVVVREQWTIENGFLTPTMKVRRGVIEERYLPRADEWKRSRQKLLWEA